ncbi:MAG: alpha/beta fold hydrolase [Roseiflexaceae bacterium]
MAGNLASRYDVLLVDARGHGRSHKPDSHYMPSDHARDVAQLITQLALVKPLVVGHSMGAMTALALAAHHAELVRAVVLEDPPLAGLGSARDAQELAGWSTGVYAWIDSMQAQSLAQLVVQCSHDNPTWQAGELVPWAQAKHDLSARIPWYEPARLELWQTLVRQLRVPTLLVLGDPVKRAILTAADAAQVRTRSPMIEIAYIRDVGHCVRREAPAAYESLIREFAQRYMEV